MSAPRAPPSDLVFQTIAWHAEDVCMDAGDGDDEDDRPAGQQQQHDSSTLAQANEQYTIKAFGVNAAGQRVALTITGFTPYFYIRLPDGWGRQHVLPILNSLRDAVGRFLAPCVLGAKLVQRKDLWGFTNGRLFSFVRLDFCTLRAYRTAWNKLEQALAVPGAGRIKFAVYEANIDPFIRFMHLRNIQPCGWVCVGAKHLSGATVLPAASRRTLDYEADWRHVAGTEADGAAAAPFTVASFDIECTSSHGDFPVPVKDYRRPAQQLADMALEALSGGAKAPTMLQLARQVTAELRGAFGLPPCSSSSSGSSTFPAAAQTGQHLSKVYTKAPLDSRLAALVDAAAEEITATLSRAPKEGRDATVQALLAKFKSMRLPELEGDPIIQVGMTVHRYGEQGVSRRIVLVLGGCAAVDGVEVRTFGSERELLLGLRDAFQEVDPDVVTGYNILGFDFWYLAERAKELGILSEFMVLGRLQGRRSAYCEKRLSSSALGDNQLRFIDMEGRVILDMMKVVQRDHKLDSYKLDAVASHFLRSNKHDVSPSDIFRLHSGGDGDRARIAAYCVQDCELVNRLLIKLETLANNVGMANVCLVPLSYIFMRGQGIKIFSLVLKQAKNDGYLVPVVRPAAHRPGVVPAAEEGGDDGDSYEGAIVLEPQVGIYTEAPVSVFDYASLYPSSMISENLSQDTIVLDPKYDNLPGVTYENVSYDVYEGAGDKRVKVGERVCRYAQPQVGPDGKEAHRGLMPRILQKLLVARKSTRKLMEQVEDPFQKAVLDGLQLAYKVTANSLYGQCGARTSPVYMKDIAACTTATGRRMILEAKKFLEEHYRAQIIYGDTDSLFCVFPQEGSAPFVIRERGHAAIMPSIQMALRAQKHYKETLKPPHSLEYEKTFWPFILLSKKRYVGNLYETDDKKFKQKSMGIVLKRRDNAPIVKRVYGGIIDVLLNKQDIGASVEFLRGCLKEMEESRTPIEDLVVTKCLRADYKDPERIAHKVLADRMALRDPGNKPQINDRIPYVYIQLPRGSGSGKSAAKVLQGERIEHPDYVKKKGLKPDTHFYITNQVMRPVLQLYATVVEKLPGYKRPANHYDALLAKLVKELGGDEHKARERLAAQKEKDVQELLFDPVLTRLGVSRENMREITTYFKPVVAQRAG